MVLSSYPSIPLKNAPFEQHLERYLGCVNRTRLAVHSIPRLAVLSIPRSVKHHCKSPANPSNFLRPFDFVGFQIRHYSTSAEQLVCLVWTEPNYLHFA
ncbi:hypothetical protein MIMGU_mgv1a017016mg [Erythranthe guttata]|uniref:Uncharacterized protein n=1 Tax=Erythranthe guttata TaxID=4155 RepID=A0A022PW96_ERYGU|nr:hypothetical protein MIMGU_mgv1a017016mg [Erythranthe guttata]